MNVAAWKNCPGTQGWVRSDHHAGPDEHNLGEVPSPEACVQLASQSAHNCEIANVHSQVGANTPKACWCQFFGADTQIVVQAEDPHGSCDIRPTAGSHGDPHISDGRGGRFDFRGANFTVYNLLSAAHTYVNALFQHTDFYTEQRLVHGSFMTAAYVTTQASNGRLLQIEYDATRAVFLKIKVDGAEPTRHRAPVSISFGNVGVSLTDRTMTIITADWAVTASSKMKKSILRGNSCSSGKCFLNVEIKPLTDVGHGKVAPHGLIAQAFDGSDVSVVGATDKYQGVEYTTLAMGEGAIEGTATDYKVADAFSSDFKFSRYGLEMAKPRNVSTLTGVKVKRAQILQGMAAASAADDVYD